MEENLINNVRNLFRLNEIEKETNDIAIKCIRNTFRLENVKNKLKAQ